MKPPQWQHDDKSLCPGCNSYKPGEHQPFCDLTFCEVPLARERDRERRVKNKRIELWAHLVSEHAAILQLDFTISDLEDIHQHEHHGPGGIRNHPEASRQFSLKRLGEVLSELEDEAVSA